MHASTILEEISAGNSILVEFMHAKGEKDALENEEKWYLREKGRDRKSTGLCSVANARHTEQQER